MKLTEGQYIATCKERNALAAAMNGHSAVYPQALCELKDGIAIFRRDGREVWRCNAAYAEFNFLLDRAEPAVRRFSRKTKLE
ncbi:hypothetical protein [Paraburkholderia bannensis]|uniref:hypothetical protein n=1 Tax=Paraburkholderia bannensis TaxID=765414 RepID=UPI002AB6604F|nr:hypothetical protein [Paraburkholderia bannensis]